MSSYTESKDFSLMDILFCGSKFQVFVWQPSYYFHFFLWLVCNWFSKFLSFDYLEPPGIFKVMGSFYSAFQSCLPGITSTFHSNTLWEERDGSILEPPLHTTSDPLGALSWTRQGPMFFMNAVSFSWCKKYWDFAEFAITSWYNP